LYGILASMSILKHIESVNGTPHSIVTLPTTSKRVLKSALKGSPIGVKNATQDEYDLILAIYDTRALLRAKIEPLWMDDDRMSDLMAMQHREVTAYQSAILRLQKPTSAPKEEEKLVLSQIITLRSKGTLITSGLPQQITTNIHNTPLRDKLLRDKDWTQETFDLIDWNNFHRAIMSVSRSHRVSVSKICHSLWNTNKQNKKFYNQTSLCPICTTSNETLNHVFSCPHPTALRAR
jgi:hypothetical protein